MNDELNVRTQRRTYDTNIDGDKPQLYTFHVESIPTNIKCT